MYTFRILSIVGLVGVAILAYGLWGRAGRTAPTTSTVHQTDVPVAQLTARDPVKQIDLEYHQPYLPPGPGHDVFAAQCVICHSPRYVLNQPLFPRKVWTAEVQKMVKAYGAPIPPDQQSEIVNYLVSWHGREESPQTVAAK